MLVEGTAQIKSGFSLPLSDEMLTEDIDDTVRKLSWDSLRLLAERTSEPPESFSVQYEIAHAEE